MTYEFYYSIPAHYHAQNRPDRQIFIRAVKIGPEPNDIKLYLGPLYEIRDEVRDPQNCMREIMQCAQIEFETRENKQMDANLNAALRIINTLRKKERTVWTYIAKAFLFALMLVAFICMIPVGIVAGAVSSVGIVLAFIFTYIKSKL